MTDARTRQPSAVWEPAGAKDEGSNPSIADPRADGVQALARELARHDDWGARVEAIELPEAEARAVRVAVLRERAFGATERYRPRPRRRRC